MKNKKGISTQRAQELENIRDIRSRHSRALALGHDNESAAAIAHGRGEISPPDRVESAAEVAAISKTNTVRLESNVSQSSPMPHAAMPQQSATSHPTTHTPQTPPATLDPERVPPNWQDLPFPRLKQLASQVSNKPISSRKEAIEIIDEALTRRP